MEKTVQILICLASTIGAVMEPCPKINHAFNFDQATKVTYCGSYDEEPLDTNGKW